MAIKRKRGSDSPSDTFVMEPSKADAGTHTQPVAAYFTSGFKLEQNRSSCTWQVYQNPQKKQLVVGRAEGVDYVNKAEASLQAGPTLCRYALGIMDKRTGVLRYSEIAGNTILRVEPHNQEMADLKEVEDSVVDNSPAGKLQANNRLINLFGSQRAKRQLSAAQAAAITDDNIGDHRILEGIFQAVADKAKANKETREDIMERLDLTRNIPPHHREATKPADAYRLDEVIPADMALVVDISSLHKAATDKEYLAEKGLRWVPQLILDRLPRLPRAAEGASSEERDQMLLALTVAGAILHLLDQPQRLVATLKQHEVSPIPYLSKRIGVKEELLQVLLDKFYQYNPEVNVGGGRKETFGQSASKRTLMTLHALVLLLMFEKFTFGPGEFDKLRRYCKMQAPHLVKLFRELGCTTKPVGKAGLAAEQQHSVVLLPPGTTKEGKQKTLADALPVIGGRAASGRGRGRGR